jgi:predicted phage baseplate assembly protein
MPLPLPRLDNRTFDQLVAEGQVLLPRYAHAWTDYNAHDPGITLLELLAWLAELGFYRLDRLTPASIRAFLHVVGGVRRAAQTAETVVVSAPLAPTDVPAGATAAGADGRAIFQATRVASLTPAHLVAVLSGPATDLLDRTQESRALSPFEPLGAAPAVGDALYLGFDGPLAPTTAPLALYVATADEAANRRTRALLDAEWASARAEALRDGAPAPADVREHYAARLAWEYHAGAGVWAPLADVEDETRALTLTGFVRFRLPAAPAHTPGGIPLPAPSARYFLRVRLAAGRYDCAPTICGVLANALAIRNAVDRPRQRLVRSNGRAAQLFALACAPVVPRSTRVEVIAGGVGDGTWKEAATWDGVGPHDRVYVLDPDDGTLTFGDGRIGRVPADGAEIWAAYQTGGGAAGNVAANTIVEIASAAGPLKVRQPFAAAGGEPAEDLEAAIGRGLAALAGPARAVTLKDFEDLVLAMPGAPIARVEALADYRPDLPCLPALGSITVVVVPWCPPARPEPSPELLCAVTRYLERRRPLTTELHVVGPCYTTVSVRARLHPKPGADGPRLTDEARNALARFLDPLRGGPDGNGWPVGRDVYRAEVLALLNDLSGVAYVDELMTDTGKQLGARCGNISVCPHGLVTSGTHFITIDSGRPCP